MILYHGTTKEKKEKIVKNGFKKSYGGACGSGVYFSKDKQTAYEYGDELVECFLEDEHIAFVDIDEVGGDASKIEDIVHENRYIAISIIYKEQGSNITDVDTTIICVYDLSYLKINNN